MCPQLTVSLSHVQQDGLLQHNGEDLVLLVLLVVDDLHVHQLPGGRSGHGTGKMDGAKEGRVNSLVSFIQEITAAVNTS